MCIARVRTLCAFCHPHALFPKMSLLPRCLFFYLLFNGTFYSTDLIVFVNKKNKNKKTSSKITRWYIALLKCCMLAPLSSWAHPHCPIGF